VLYSLRMDVRVILACAAYTVWSLCIVTVETESGQSVRGISTANIRTQFSETYAVPPYLTQIWKHDQHRKIPVPFVGYGRHSIGTRPVSGDHIHMAMSIWIGDTPRPPEHDRPYEQDIPYESVPTMCTKDKHVAYTKLWPHSGVHTHCDGLIHVHPWSAPASLRKEGLGVRLGLWFDQVGIEYTSNGLAFQDTSRLDNNATHTWRLAEYVCVHDTSYNVYESQLDRVWLGHAYASYVLWYGTSPRPPPMLRAHVDILKDWGATGFDGEPYPQTCI